MQDLIWLRDEKVGIPCKKRQTHTQVLPDSTTPWGRTNHAIGSHMLRLSASTHERGNQNSVEAMSARTVFSP